MGNKQVADLGDGQGNRELACTARNACVGHTAHQATGNERHDWKTAAKEPRRTGA